MADLNFVYDGDCSDVNVTTPTVGYNYIEYMSKKSTKDFYNFRNYKITYSKDCTSQSTVLVPPDYNLNLSFTCSLNSSSQGELVFKLTGINPDFISTIQTCNNTFTTCVNTTITKKHGYITFPGFAVTGTPANYNGYVKLTTIDGFEYRITFLLTSTGSTNCTYKLTSFSSAIYISGVAYTLPSYLNTPTSKLDLNLLFNQINLDPGYYDIKICETSSVNEVCLQNRKFLDCQVFTCPTTFTCNPTDDDCQLMLDVLKKHQSLEYGLVCCENYSQNILEFYIKLYCPTELTC